MKVIFLRILLQAVHRVEQRMVKREVKNSKGYLKSEKESWINVRERCNIASIDDETVLKGREDEEVFNYRGSCKTFGDHHL